MTSSLTLGSNVTSPETEIVPKIIDDATSFYSTAVLQVLSCSFSLLGIVANSINIAVFLRQGAKSDSTSAGLLGLAVTDLTHLVTSLWLSAGQALIIYGPRDLWWVPMDLVYLFNGIPNYMSAQITKMATAYVALQRCICVVFPFKVKSLFTSRRTLVVFVLLFVVTGLGFVPLLVSVYRLGFKLDPFTNRTRFGFIATKGYQTKVNSMLYANNVTFTMGSVGVVLLSTAVTVYQLNLSKNWRDSVSSSSTSSSTSKSENESKKNSKQTETDDGEGQDAVKSKSSGPKQSKMQKEKKLVKVIVSISIIFLVTYCFNIVYLITTYVNPHARMFGKNHNLAQLLMGVAFMVETLNSSINIVVYYTLSSGYKQEFRSMFGMGAENKK